MDNPVLKPIPLTARRSAVTMGLLWLTMVTSFPAVLAGFEWYRQGISFNQLICCSLISILLLLLYSVPACQLGASTGLGYCALGRTIFGRWGAALLAMNLIWLFVAWYGLTAVLMAQAIINLFHQHLQLIWLSTICAMLMSFNNFFGFKGVANFARFMGGPVLIVWVGYVFFKVLSSPIATANTHLPHPTNMYALALTSSFIIGFAVWGNEQDYWRYSKAGIWRSMIPLLASFAIGQAVFPMAGWLIARASSGTDFGSTATFMSNYCFGSIAIIGLFIITADYFSTNDSSLFGCVAALESIKPLNHSLSVAIFALAGTLVAALLSLTDMAESLCAMVSLNCIILPIPTIIMLTESWLRKQAFHAEISFDPVPDLAELPAVRWPAIIALFAGLIVGIATSGLISAFECCHFGICSLQAWLTSIIVYILLRIYEYNKRESVVTEH